MARAGLLALIALTATVAMAPAQAEVKPGRPASKPQSPYQVRVPAEQYQLRGQAADTSALPYDAEVARAAARQHVDPALLHAIIHVESRHSAVAVSPKGAVGLMQVLPETGKRFGAVDVHDPRQNVQAGASYLRTLLDRYDQNLDFALAAYNAGEGAVARYGRVPPYAETMQYIPAVKARYQALQPPSPYRLRSIKSLPRAEARTKASADENKKPPAEQAVSGSGEP